MSYYLLVLESIIKQGIMYKLQYTELFSIRTLSSPKMVVILRSHCMQFCTSCGSAYQYNLKIIDNRPIQKHELPPTPTRDKGNQFTTLGGGGGGGGHNTDAMLKIHTLC